MDDTKPDCGGELARRLLMEVAEPLGISGEEADAADDAAKVASALQMLQAAAPRDALEAMLAAQMAAVHSAAMRALRQAAKCTDYPQIEALYARQAAQLMALFQRQTEALEKRHARDASAQRAAQAGAARVAQAAEADAENAEAQAVETVAATAKRRPIVAARPRKSDPPRPPEHRNESRNGKRNGHRRPINGDGPPPFAA